MAEIQRRCGLHLEQLGSALRALVEQVRALTQAHQRTADAVSDLKDLLLESTCRDKMAAYFLPLLWRARLVSYETLGRRRRPSGQRRLSRLSAWQEALIQAQAAHPGRPFYLIRIGYKAAHKLKRT